MKPLITLLLFISLLSARDFRISLAAVTDLHFVYGETSDLWQASPTGGIEVGLPVAGSNFLFLGELQGGKLMHKVTNDTLSMVYTSLRLGYPVKVIERLTLVPQAGLCNMMYLGSNGVNLTKPFADDSENEFGFELDAFVRFKPEKRLFFSGGYGIVSILSEPAYFTYGRFVLQCGVEL